MCKKFSPKLRLASVFSQQLELCFSIIPNRTPPLCFFLPSHSSSSSSPAKKLHFFSPRVWRSCAAGRLVMGVRRSHWLCLSASLALFFFFFFSAATGTALVGITMEKGEKAKLLENQRWGQAAASRRLVGPGSSPPTCRLRCNRCFPCRPVHVAIQPGRSMPLEYYPEAWRCKCGNRLFMPWTAIN